MTLSIVSKKLSFFTLPLIFVALFFIFSVLIILWLFLYPFIGVIDHFYLLWSIISDYILYLHNEFYNLIPVALLSFIVSAFALNRCNIHIFTLKNLLLLEINVVIVKIFDLIFDHIFVNSDLLARFIAPNSSGGIVTAAISYNVLKLTLIGLIIYFYIKLMSPWFDKSKQVFELNQQNSTRIHFVLFIALYMFLFVVFTALLLFTTLTISNYYHASELNEIFPLMVFLINLLLVILISRKQFKQTFVVLQTDRIIKSALLINLFTVIFNLLCLALLFNNTRLIYWANNLRSHFSYILPLITLLISMICPCFIVSSITRYYFAGSTKAHMLFK